MAKEGGACCLLSGIPGYLGGSLCVMALELLRAGMDRYFHKVDPVNQEEYKAPILCRNTFRFCCSVNGVDTWWRQTMARCISTPGFALSGTSLDAIPPLAQQDSGVQTLHPCWKRASAAPGQTQVLDCIRSCFHCIPNSLENRRNSPKELSNEALPLACLAHIITALGLLPAFWGIAP
eukprot:3902101-Rhodomonas_salina.1